MSCLVCGDPKTDRCHIKSRGSGGSDQEFNLMKLCRVHHVEQHKIGLVTFVRKYPEVLEDVVSKGWAIVQEFDRSLLRRYEK